MKNIYILTLPRSGSSYFFKLMSQSPDIVHRYYEPFNDELLKTESEFYELCVSKINEIKLYKNGVLVKDTINYINYLDHEIGDVYNYRDLFLDFYNVVNSNFYVIKLHRRDIFNQAVSNCIAELTGKWTTYNGEYKFPVVNIDTDLLKSKLDIHKKSRSFLINYPHCDKELYYEDIIENYDLTKEWIFDFLTPPDVIKPEFTTLNPPKHRVVSNYNELVDWYNNHKDQYEIKNDN